MKHVLNFVPTVKYRGESSFMFKTIIGLLYAIPAMMVTAMTIEYLDLDWLIKDVQSMTERLDKRTGEFNKVLADARPDREEFQANWDRIFEYHRSLKASHLSWTTLFGYLEEVLPAQVRMRRVRVRPASSVKVSIDGEAYRLEDVTALLRGLFAHPRFSRPRLVRHARLSPAMRKGFAGSSGDAAAGAAQRSGGNALDGAAPLAVAADPISFFLEVEYLPPSEVRP